MNDKAGINVYSGYFYEVRILDVAGGNILRCNNIVIFFFFLRKTEQNLIKRMISLSSRKPQEF